MKQATNWKRLADDVHQYFGLGCRNVTQLLHVPKAMTLCRCWKLLENTVGSAIIISTKTTTITTWHMHLLNNKYYMTNGSILLVEMRRPFSPNQPVALPIL
jgi:hypothetical protein